MKKIAIYVIMLVVLCNSACSRTEELLETQGSGKLLTVRAELISASDWITTRSEYRTIYGSASESTDGEYLITACKQEWMGIADTIPIDIPMTRGTPIGSVAGIANMRVNVFRTDMADWSASAPLTRAVDATNVAGGFTTSPSYNWPTDAAVKTSLFAYSPILTVDNGLTDNLHNKLNYTVPSDVTKQPDLCVAAPYMNVINSNGVQQVKTFALSHQLAAVGFRMLGWNLKITKITVSGVAVTGTLTMNTESAPTWATSTIGSRDVGVTGGSYQHTIISNYSDITSSNGYLMMIPQALTDGATVTIIYESTDKGSLGGTLIAKLKDLGLTWDAGDKITYDIRLKTAPAVTTNELIIESDKAGYTTSQPLAFMVDNQDNLTFTWDAPWLKIHRGDPKVGDVSGGYVSDWSTSSGGPWSNIYFFATEDNPSTLVPRAAEVTVTGTRSGTRKFMVKQQYVLPTLSLSSNTSPSVLSWNGATTKITLSSNTSWTVSSRSNCTVTPSSGTGNMAVSIRASINQGLRRDVSCTFTTTNTSNNVSRNWESTQSSSPFELTPAAPKANFGVLAGTYSIVLTLGTSWSISSQKNCTITPSSGSGTSYGSTPPTLTLTYSAYNGTTDREVSFVVNADGRTPIKWTGLQEAPYFSVNCDIPNGAIFNWQGYYGNSAQLRYFQILTNTTWKAWVTDNIGLRWTVDGHLPASGYGVYKTQVTGAYEMFERRTAQIKVTGYRPDGSIIATDTRTWQQNH